MYFIRIVVYILTSSAVSVSAFANEDYNVAKVCRGASDEQPKSGDDTAHYNYLKNMFTNCTYVSGNIEIHDMRSLIGKSLDFFKDVVEVSGYVRVVGPLPQGTTKLPFEKLQIIRGESLVARGDGDEKQYSLFLYNLNEIRNLGLTALREISRGNAYIAYNQNNCYGENTTDWLDIFHDPERQKSVVDIRDDSNCPPISRRCDASCNGFCWGPGPSDCQKRNKNVCADQCDYRCYGSESNQCCHSSCLAGCEGPLATDCWGCRDFYNNGTCVYECPRAKIYNKTTYKFEVNPEAKVAFGKLCLPKCPSGFLEHNEGCLMHKCPGGFKEEHDKCVECDGPCPQECDWTYLQGKDDYWMTSSFLKNTSNHNCTKIVGHVQFLSTSFEQQRRIKYIGELPVTVDDLKVFETVEQITGMLVFEPGDRLPGLTSLDVFKNLKKIKGVGAQQGSGGYSLIIDSDHLTSFGMTNLTNVSSGAILVTAPQMCYVDSAMFQRISSPKFTPTVEVKEPSICAADGMVCAEECRSACVGPSDLQCISTCTATDVNCPSKCKNFEFERRCMASCSGEGLYANGTMCTRCHNQCKGTCSGPLDTQCSDCKNYKNGDKCVAECPKPTYLQLSDSTCQPCSDRCNNKEGFGCTGPKPTVGDEGCEACNLLLLSDDGSSVMSCLNSSASCPSGYLTITQRGKINKMLTSSINLAGFKEACWKCSEECAECETQPFYCTSCSDIAYRVVKQHDTYVRTECAVECDDKKNYKNETTRQCIECADTCDGCTGPTDLECKRCSGHKVYLNGTTDFQCVDVCPPHLNFTWLEGKSSDRVCQSYAKPSTRSATQEQSFNAGVVAGPVVAAVVVIALAAIIITYYCRQKKLHIEKAKEYELRIYGPGTIEPITPSDANPDVSRLRLVKESELKRASIIGSGAFGTVFKGFLIPDGENVKVPVAIKVLIEGTSPSQTTELLDEARVMASVDHPCCIKIIAVCMTAEMMLITPLMPEGCLLSYIKSRVGQLGSKVLINWCAQIARGMEHLQGCGIVHRDLAARNVLVQSETQVKITDFGLAKLLDVDEDYYKAESGKVPVKWMALESIQHRIFNHQTDVWSYGVTVWEIFTFGQKPYDGVKARDIAILLERGERLSQPTISTIDMYMIMIKCWMLDANTRPTFEDLTKEFTKMARDPGRYLVIDGDQLKRNPTLKMNNDWMFDDLQIDDEYPNKQLMDADDYLSPSIASNSYPRYENDNVNLIPPPFEKSLQQSTSADDLHSPLRYTSSPTLRDFPDYPGKLTVDTEDYLQPVSVRGTLSQPPVGDDGYLQPLSHSGGYIDVLADDRTNISPIKKSFNELDDVEADEASKPLLGADNSIYLYNSPDDLTSSAHPTCSTPPDGTNPIYMSNNNGSPTIKQACAPQDYQNIDYVNQKRITTAV